MKTLVWGHRGSRKIAPENTLESFSLAAEQGADGIELDVHLSSDGEIVVAHDETVERVSNGSGLIVSKTFAELRSLDFSKGFPTYSPVRIPSLREVFELIRPTSLSINIEIKSGIVLYKGIEQKCVELAREMNMQDRVLYSSFNHYSLLAVREADPHAKIGLLYQEALVDPHLYAIHLKADAIHPYYPTLFVPGIIQACKENNIKTHPWTVNDPNVMRQLISAGVDALITDTPDVALQIVKEVNSK